MQSEAQSYMDKLMKEARESKAEPKEGDAVADQSSAAGTPEVPLLRIVLHVFPKSRARVWYLRTAALHVLMAFRGRRERRSHGEQRTEAPRLS